VIPRIIIRIKGETHVDEGVEVVERVLGHGRDIARIDLDGASLAVIRLQNNILSKYYIIKSS
jgi:hypothetical protein